MPVYLWIGKIVGIHVACGTPEFCGVWNLLQLFELLPDSYCKNHYLFAQAGR